MHCGQKCQLSAFWQKLYFLPKIILIFLIMWFTIFSIMPYPVSHKIFRHNFSSYLKGGWPACWSFIFASSLSKHQYTISSCLIIHVRMFEVGAVAAVICWLLAAGVFENGWSINSPASNSISSSRCLGGGCVLKLLKSSTLFGLLKVLCWGGALCESSYFRAKIHQPIRKKLPRHNPQGWGSSWHYYTTFFRGIAFKSCDILVNQMGISWYKMGKMITYTRNRRFRGGI